MYPYARADAEFQLIATGFARAWYEDPALNRPPDPVSPRLWVHAKQQVHGWQDDSGGESRIAVFQFSTLPPLIEDLLRETPALSFPVPYNEARDIMQWAESARALPDRNTSVNILTLEKILLDLSILLLRRFGNTSPARWPARSEQRVEEACSLYIGHLKEQWSIERIAAEIGVSPPHLRRLFLQIKGRPPKEVFTEIRMNIARRRLNLGEETVAELSEQLGYSEPSAFSRAYTRYTGHSPRHTRKNCSQS